MRLQNHSMRGLEPRCGSPFLFDRVKKLGSRESGAIGLRLRRAFLAGPNRKLTPLFSHHRGQNPNRHAIECARWASAGGCGRRDQYDAAAVEALFVDLFLDAHSAALPQITLDLDA